MTCWLLWLYDPEAVWLSALESLRNWQRLYNYIQPIWRSWRMAASRSVTLLKLLACLLQKFGGIIDFAGSGLAQGQLSNRLCKAMDSGIFHRSRSFHTTGLSSTQGLQ